MPPNCLLIQNYPHLFLFHISPLLRRIAAKKLSVLHHLQSMSVPVEAWNQKVRPLHEGLLFARHSRWYHIDLSNFSIPRSQQCPWRLVQNMNTQWRKIREATHGDAAMPWIFLEETFFQKKTKLTAHQSKRRHGKAFLWQGHGGQGWSACLLASSYWPFDHAGKLQS